MDLRTARDLTSPDALRLVSSLVPYAEDRALATAERLRREGLPADLAAAVMQQAALRTRGRAKLGDRVDALLLTSDGLEQATRPTIARHHAARLRDAGVAHVHDLGCGLGLDALAAVDAGLAVTAVDADEVTAVLAAHNLATADLQDGQALPRVHHARAADVDLAGAGRRTAVWLDPARRTPGVADVTGRTRRTWRLDDLAPSWEVVQDLAGRVGAAGAKLSPAFPHAARPDGAEAQWVSWRGEVLECCVWWGDAVRTPGRTALVLGGTEDGTTSSLVTEADLPAARPATPTAPAQWVYEPDRAVLRAGLVGALEALVDGAELDDGVGYVTSPAEREVPWARRLRVLEVLPLHDKAIRAHLRGLGVGAVTLKKRGVDVDPDRLRRSLRLKGSGRATLVLTRLAGRPVALHVDPC